MGEYFNKIRFEPYRSTRPKLLDELQRILQEVPEEAETEGIGPQLEHCRHAFQRYIEESNIYKDSLLRIKEGYEMALNSFEHQHYECLRLQIELEKNDTEHQRYIFQLQNDWNKKLSFLEHTNVLIQRESMEQRKQLKIFEEANQLLEKQTKESNEEKNDLKKTCIVLSKALKGLEERDRERQLLLEETKSEIQSLQEAQASSQDEISRLRLTIQQLENFQATLVPRSALDEQESRIAHLTEKLDTVRVNDKHLLFRYMTLKGAIAKVK